MKKESWCQIGIFISIIVLAINEITLDRLHEQSNLRLAVIPIIFLGVIIGLIYWWSNET